MAVRSLAYIRVETTDLGTWHAFGTGVIGAQVTASEDPDRLLLRIDDRPWRFRIERGDTDRFLAAGFEFPSVALFDQGLKQLESAGVTVTIASEAQAQDRGALRLATCRDPGGNLLELVCGHMVTGTPFVSPAGVSGFVAGGDLGMGHVVLPTDAYDATRSFYRDLLGFGDSDEMRVHFPGAPDQGLGLSFLHASGPRHHAVAVGEFPAPAGAIHAMLEVRTIDDVGLALDRALAAGVHISATLGRHTNDRMVSFYMRSPGGFDIEYGCDGLQFEDWSRFTPTVTIKEDLWGHRWDFGAGGA